MLLFCFLLMFRTCTPTERNMKTHRHTGTQDMRCAMPGTLSVDACAASAILSTLVRHTEISDSVLCPCLCHFFMGRAAAAHKRNSTTWISFVNDRETHGSCALLTPGTVPQSWGTANACHTTRRHIDISNPPSRRHPTDRHTSWQHPTHRGGNTFVAYEGICTSVARQTQSIFRGDMANVEPTSEH